jgi:hypothetical protein
VGTGHGLQAVYRILGLASAFLGGMGNAGRGVLLSPRKFSGAIPFRDARTPVMNTIASISISPRIRVRVAIRGVVQMEASGKIETLRFLILQSRNLRLSELD